MSLLWIHTKKPDACPKCKSVYIRFWIGTKIEEDIKNHLEGATVCVWIWIQQ